MATPKKATNKSKTTTASTAKGKAVSVLGKVKNAVGEVLAGAASGAVAGAVESAAKVGGGKADPKPTGRGVNSKDTKAKSATAAQEKATKPAKAKKPAPPAKPKPAKKK